MMMVKGGGKLRCPGTLNFSPRFPKVRLRAYVEPLRSFFSAIMEGLTLGHSGVLGSR